MCICYRARRQGTRKRTHLISDLDDSLVTVPTADSLSAAVESAVTAHLPHESFAQGKFNGHLPIWLSVLADNKHSTPCDLAYTATLE